MKKIVALLLIFVFALTLTSCKDNEVETHSEKIILEFPADYLKYLPYEEVPNFVFEFEGTLNTATGVGLSNSKMFSNNDDFVLSEIISNLLKGYEEKDRLSYRLISTDDQYETRMNTLEPDKDGHLKHKSHVMKVKDGKVFEEIALIDLDEDSGIAKGLTLSIYYRRFVSDYEGEFKTYYAWSYRTLMEMVLHFPLMLHLNDKGEKEFLIVPVPTNVDYHLGVSRQLPLENLLKKDDYFKENFRSFNYPDYSDDPSDDNSDFDLEANIQKVKDFYMRDFNGIEEDGKIIFSYLGYNFIVDFIVDIKAPFFKISILD